MKKDMLPTKRNSEKTSAERIAIIKSEFEAGFKFLEDHPRSVTIFGSSRFKEDSKYYQHARVLGQKIAKDLGYAVLTGGGPGIMEAANRGAYEVGGSSLGLTINLPEGQPVNRYLTEHIHFYYFFSRKVCLSFSAQAFVFYPGGFGTLDECLEILTLVQTKKINKVPVILSGKDYWQDFDSLFEDLLVKRFKTIDEKDRDLYAITDNHDEIIDIIKGTSPREGIKYCGEDLI
ncbi:MAG: hypothetical protein G01um1014107_84 [Parcubacteria group bacterium Gr01-1014_107]|nr:MAG: hypothetical protein G01um1014107_84 [Parcubacteria group bacterium Gr01-1014_107]